MSHCYGEGKNQYTEKRKEKKVVLRKGKKEIESKMKRFGSRKQGEIVLLKSEQLYLYIDKRIHPRLLIATIFDRPGPCRQPVYSITRVRKKQSKKVK
jgi:hypothetical protein